MKRFRLSTLILLVVIAALIFALVGERCAAHREAVLEARLAQANEVMAEHYSLGFIEIADKPAQTKQKK